MGNFVLTRTIFDKTVVMPSYYLSVTYRDLSQRKERWAREKNIQRVRPNITKWNIPLEDNPYAGLVAKINSHGIIEATVPSDFLHGIMNTKEGLLSASHHTVTLHSFDLSSSNGFISLPSFNALHSMRHTNKGFLLTSPGTDAIFEISLDDKKILWEWWATEHDYTKDSFDVFRDLDKTNDHRTVEYDTWLHTAHVNAAAEWDENTVLATLFMKGTLVKINKKTGESTTLLADLKRPHSVRKYSDGKISLSDTARGEALYGSVVGDTFKLENKVNIKTAWLQDSLRLGNTWLLVDGEHSSVHLLDTNNNILISDQFDPDWYLYEATPENNLY